MKLDPIKQFIALRESLQNQKATLETRLKQINQALNAEASAPRLSAAGKGRTGKRVKNKLTLRAAIAEATKARPLTKAEILTAVKKLGYQFASKNPVSSLNAILYRDRQFKNTGGKFSPS